MPLIADLGFDAIVAHCDLGIHDALHTAAREGISMHHSRLGVVFRNTEIGSSGPKAQLTPSLSIQSLLALALLHQNMKEYQKATQFYEVCAVCRSKYAHAGYM